MQRSGRPGRHPTSFLALFAALAAALSGCGKGAGDGLVPVTGKVTVDGKPLTTGAVSFHPDASRGNTTPHIPVGVLDEQGNYRLVSATREGAPPGWYRVTVAAQGPGDEKNPYAPPKWIINPRFGDVQTSKLEVQVVENAAPGSYDFKVTK